MIYYLHINYTYSCFFAWFTICTLTKVKSVYCMIYYLHINYTYSCLLHGLLSAH